MRLPACLLVCALSAAAPAAEPAVTRTFDVAAITVPVSDYPAPPLGKVAAPAPTPTPPADRAARTAALLRALEAVAPDAAGWAAFGDAGRTLTVTHSPTVVGRVAARLADLEAAATLGVSVETRVLTLPVGVAAGCGLTAAGRPAILDSEQLTRALAAAQGHRLASVLQTPKVTVFDGQRAGLWAGEEQQFVTAVEPGKTAGGETMPLPKSETYRTGTAVELRPVVAADRRAVALEVGFEQAEIDGPVPLFPVTHFVTPTFEGGSVGKPVPFTQFIQQPVLARRAVREAATVPDGSTLMLAAGPKTGWVDAPSGPLAGVPYLNRLTTTRTPVQLEVVVLLTVWVLPGDGR